MNLGKLITDEQNRRKRAIARLRWYLAYKDSNVLNIKEDAEECLRLAKVDLANSILHNPAFDEEREAIRMLAQPILLEDLETQAYQEQWPSVPSIEFDPDTASEQALRYVREAEDSRRTALQEVQDE